MKKVIITLALVAGFAVVALSQLHFEKQADGYTTTTTTSTDPGGGTRP